jgi:diacylglycerol kinase (ATP)
VIAIVFNPTARGDKAISFLRELNGFGRSARLLPTRHAGDASDLARQAVREGATTVVAAGGDGTVNEVLNGLARAPGGLVQARLGVLPLGTVNVFAKELGLPGRLDAAWRVASGESERRIDLPCASWPDGRTRWFVQMAGAGLDSLSISRVSWRLKKAGGPLAYVWACVRTMSQPRPRVVAEVGTERLHGPLICLGNGRFLGGRYPVFARAELDDGLLDLVVFPKVTWITVARVFPRLLNGTFGRSTAAHHRQVTSLTVTGDAGLPFQVEGDNVGPLPVTIRIAAGALRVAAPPKKAGPAGRSG